MGPLSKPSEASAGLRNGVAGTIQALHLTGSRDTPFRFERPNRSVGRPEKIFRREQAPIATCVFQKQKSSVDTFSFPSENRSPAFIGLFPVGRMEIVPKLPRTQRRKPIIDRHHLKPRHQRPIDRNPQILPGQIYVDGS